MNQWLFLHNLHLTWRGEEYQTDQKPQAKKDVELLLLWLFRWIRNWWPPRGCSSGGVSTGQEPQAEKYVQLLRLRLFGWIRISWLPRGCSSTLQVFKQQFDFIFLNGHVNDISNHMLPSYTFQLVPSLHTSATYYLRAFWWWRNRYFLAWTVSSPSIKARSPRDYFLENDVSYISDPGGVTVIAERTEFSSTTRASRFIFTCGHCMHLLSILWCSPVMFWRT